MAFNDVVYIENTKILYPNFSGKGGPINPEGRRNFCLVIPDDRVEELLDLGLNVKSSKPSADGYVSHYLKVDVNYTPPQGIAKPRITLFLDDSYADLDEDTVKDLDDSSLLTIISVDCSFRLYRYNDAGNCSAKLSEMLVYARESYISARRRAMIESRCAEE